MSPSQDRPLTGRRVAVTRGAERAGGMVDGLRAAGAEVLLAPAIEIRPPADPEPVDAALGRLGRYDWVVFTSANAVDRTCERLLALGPGPAALRPVRRAAVGEATAAALEAWGLGADLVPATFSADGLLDAFPPLAGLRILVPRAERGRETFPEGARARGADVEVVAAYRTVERPEAGRLLRPRLEAGTLDAVAFTSPSTVHAVLEGLGADGPALLRRVRVAAIGPTTAEALARAGVTDVIQPARFDAAALVEAIVSAFSNG